uniref:Cytochrome b5 heme-binding domain-containing protein n=1 Tax=Arcella intermedia TaxID=1963864 RepID=A0A6B2LUR8_9EUKA
MDVTPFLKSHPGGKDALMKFAGTDLMPAFGYVGHSSKAIEMTSKYVIGVVDKDSEPLPKETST